MRAPVAIHNTAARLEQALCDLRCAVRGHDPIRLTRHSLTWCRECGRDLPNEHGRVMYR